MKTKLFLILIMLMLPLTLLCQTKRQQKKADEQTQSWRYEIESTGVGTQGSQILKVWSYSSNPNVAAEQSKKNAIHGLLFKGVAAKNGAPERRPMLSEQDKEQNKDFFEAFFANGGDYMMYVTETSPEYDVLKISKKEYKVGVNITVTYNELRKRLEKEGILKSLSYGF